MNTKISTLFVAQDPILFYTIYRRKKPDAEADPQKKGKRLSICDDFELSNEKTGSYYIGVHRVLRECISNCVNGNNILKRKGEIYYVTVG